MRTVEASTGVWLAAAGAGLLVGTAWQLQQVALCAASTYGALAASASAVLMAGMKAWGRHQFSSSKPLLAAVIVWLLVWAALGFSATGWRASQRLAHELPGGLEGADLMVVGVIAGLPQRAPEAWRFQFEVESARRDNGDDGPGAVPLDLPPRLSLGWYASERTELPALRAGQRWQLAVRLKRPHGTLNPHGFDYELLLFEQGVRATGYVRALPARRNRLLAEAVGHPVDRLRQSVREAIVQRLAARHEGQAGEREAGVLTALSIGDQAAIDRDDWALYRNTGVAHLMSISGLHVTMFAWLAGGLVGGLWRRSVQLMLWCPAPVAARWGGLAAALAYSIFAGWGVPAQRTVLMLATVTLLGAAGLRWRWPLVWGAAMVAVVVIDPWALLQAGFWLSFAAVGLLMAAGGSADDRELLGAWPARLAAAAKGGLRTQFIATLGLAPLTLVFFQQLSLVGFIANLLAIPLVTLVITPLALLGALLPPLWVLAAWCVQALNAVLQALAEPAWAVWSVAAAPAWAVASALLASALSLLPIPWRVRLLAVPLLLPLLVPAVARPAAGQFDLMAIDVGQGTAVLLRTATHTLLYDAGPQYSRESDAGERVIVPLLRALGEARLDLLVLSHRDTDHVGGAAAVLRAVPVSRLTSSLEEAHPLRTLAAQRGASVQPCQAGQRWQWDGVDFEMLHPAAETLAAAEQAAIKPKPNTLSCVLRAGRSASGSVLLTGDLERVQELALVARHGSSLASEVLLVPHHGSKTSSSAALLEAVAPRVSMVQAGYRNRFGHPAAQVMARYAERGIEVLDSPRCGAWHYRSDGATDGSNRCWRTLARRYWHHPDIPAPQNGVEVAIPDPATDAVPTAP